MLEDLKKEVCAANVSLPNHGLVIFTEGNVSALSKDGKYVAIKPSGVRYEDLSAADIVITDMDGEVIEGKLKPSTDLPTHLEIYRKFPAVKCIVHTHSPHATIFAQRKVKIPCLGTTHADNFYGDIPVTRDLKKREIENDYELSTGKAICEVLDMDIPAVLVANHGPFAFGRSIPEAVNNAAVLEKVAFLALHGGKKIPSALLDKHYLRKHGKESYYGQK